MKNEIKIYKRMVVDLKTGMHSSIDSISICNCCHDLYCEKYTNQEIETYLKFDSNGIGKMICCECGTKNK